MARFRTKPFEVEAKQWFKDGDHGAVVPTGGGFDAKAQVFGKQGWAGVHPGDWIIAEPDGSGFYPCKPDVFEAKYEPIEDQS